MPQNVAAAPVPVFLVSLALLWFAGRLGTLLRTRWGERNGDALEDIGLLTAASLTLLGLIIGFSFSMSITRYDQRKHYEEVEANAVGTVNLRAGLLPAPDQLRLRQALTGYLDERIRFYSAAASPGATPQQRQWETRLWQAVQTPAQQDRSPVMALVIASVNDVIDSSGSTQASWWNRIPLAAWLLLEIIALCANFLVGYSLKQRRVAPVRLLILPLIVSISFFLIADIDSPGGGAIRVSPLNLIALRQSLAP